MGWWLLVKHRRRQEWRSRDGGQRPWAECQEAGRRAVGVTVRIWAFTWSQSRALGGLSADGGTRCSPGGGGGGILPAEGRAWDTAAGGVGAAGPDWAPAEWRGGGPGHAADVGSPRLPRSGRGPPCSRVPWGETRSAGGKRSVLLLPDSRVNGSLVGDHELPRGETLEVAGSREAFAGTGGQADPGGHLPPALPPPPVPR